MFESVETQEKLRPQGVEEHNPSARRTLERIIQRGAALPAMPATGAELMAIGRQPIDRVDIQRVVSLVECDPGLTARLLRVANSPFFGLGGRVTGVRHALTLLGLDEALNIFNYHLLSSMMAKIPVLDGFASEQFWIHSWACATTARFFGRPEFLVRSLPGELGMAGLLHDVGKSVLALNLSDDFQRCLHYARGKGVRLDQAEQEILGVDHAMLGAYLLERWNLPQTILDGVRWHHDPGQAGATTREIASLIQLADIIANQCAVGSAGNPVEPSLEEAWGLQSGDTPFASERVKEQICAEIIQSLRKKADMLSYADLNDLAVGETGAAEGGGHNAERAARSPRPMAYARPRPREGLWARAWRWAVSLVQGG
ncbi:MAG: HDOD domain-containing protein [Candidatus Sumerlaeota bacterium]|nr:HDOD domain-containing protein [Candidatus Sumerlaeota bacterium]